MASVPRYILMPVGYVAGCVAAAVVIVFAVGGLENSGDSSGAGLAAQLIAAIAAYTAMLAILPMAIAVVGAEILLWRSALVWLVIGAAIGIIALLTIGRFTPGISVERPWLFVVAGLALGLVYWAIAGRRSGGRRAISSAPGSA